MCRNKRQEARRKKIKQEKLVGKSLDIRAFKTFPPPRQETGRGEGGRQALSLPPKKLSGIGFA